MRRICILAAFYAISMHGAAAAEITVKVSDADQQNFASLPGAVDACVAGLQLRGDAQMCKAISSFAKMVRLIWKTYCDVSPLQDFVGKPGA